MSDQEIAHLDAELYISVAEIKSHYEKAVVSGGDASLNPQAAMHRMYAALSDVQTTTRKALELSTGSVITRKSREERRRPDVSPI